MSVNAIKLNTDMNSTTPTTTPVRVMVVDDSVVVQGLVSRWIEEDPALKFAGKFSNGLKAVEGVAAADPDVIILDIEMPVMTGLEALPKLLELAPHAKIIMASTLTPEKRRNKPSSDVSWSLRLLPKTREQQWREHLHRVQA